MARRTLRNPHAAQRDYFGMLARLGVTKHLGSEAATDELAAACHIGAGSRVLEVGCGAGATAAYLARKLDCHVVGVDPVHTLLREAEALARRRGVGSRVRFHAADAQALPFAADSFDAVLVESVNGFLDDMALGFREYARVLRPGGYAGVTEAVWLAPPTDEARRFVATLGVHIFDAASWPPLFEQAGFEMTSTRIHTVRIQSEIRGCLTAFGLGGVLRATRRLIPLLFSSPAARTLVWRGAASIPEGVYEVLGYGTYTAQRLA